MKKDNPVTNAKTRLNIFIKMESLAVYESKGSIPWPSCTIELVNGTENGISPGADSGINPTKALIKRIQPIFPATKPYKFQ